MSFLSATLLLGTLAAGVPVVLHLLARQPPRRVVFPSVRFLQRHLTTQTSRLQVRRWWLLALRILALVALAIVLARPHIDAKMSSQWMTVALIGLAGVGLLAMASVALVRGFGRALAWSLLGAAVIAMVGAGIATVRAFASGTAPVLQLDQPLAIAIVIDNSPSSAWQVSEDTSGVGIADEEDVTGSRLAVAIARAGTIVGQLPAGSRVAIVDRSASPAGFSFDEAAAQARLSRITASAAPAPIADRIAAAVELVRTSDLPNRHVLVISDMAAATWDAGLPGSPARSPLAAANREHIPVSIFNIHESATIDPESQASLDTQPASPTLNAWLSLPVVADVAPPPGVAVPIRVDIGVWSSEQNEIASSAGNGSRSSLRATVQLSLYEQDPALPVVRDGQVVLPALRSVDRVAVDLQDASPADTQEVVLTLPPLGRGTYHAVVELNSPDRFAWDNRRYVSIDLPSPPRVLIVGDDRDEINVLAAAMTAPHAVEDPLASYQIERAGYVDLGAVDWKRFEMVVLIDPPLQLGASAAGSARPANALSTAILDDIADVVSRGGGLLVSLGPSAQANRSGPPASAPSRGDAATDVLLPPLIRSWRIPPPGTFWRVSQGSHPVFDSLLRPSSMPNWADFRIHRYWQLGEPADWDVLARYASSSGAGSTSHAAVLTRSLGSGRVAVTTTPLPALGPTTRSWNDLFGAADAWPAFMTVRGLAAWLAGLDRQSLTIQTGQTGLVSLAADSSEMALEAAPTNRSGELLNTADRSGEDAGGELRSLQLYAPGQSTTRSLPWTGSTVIVNEVDTPGTYFVRAPNVWTGVSANLPLAWSDGKTTSLQSLKTWFGEEDWSITRQLDALSLSGGGSGSAAVSLHAPLTLLALFVFLLEQVLSNRFYGGTREPGVA